MATVSPTVQFHLHGMRWPPLVCLGARYISEEFCCQKALPSTMKLCIGSGLVSLILWQLNPDSRKRGLSQTAPESLDVGHQQFVRNLCWESSERSRNSLSSCAGRDNGAHFWNGRHHEREICVENGCVGPGEGLRQGLIWCGVYCSIFAAPAKSLRCDSLWPYGARQAPLSMGFSRQEYWGGLPCPPLGELPDPGMEPESLASSALAGRFLITSTTWEAHF